MIHSIKISPKYFDAVETGIKPFEVRKNDRPFAVGDVLSLNEWDGEKYSGRYTNKAITYILDDREYCVEGYVILGLKNA